MSSPHWQTSPSPSPTTFPSSVRISPSDEEGGAANAESGEKQRLEVAEGEVVGEEEERGEQQRLEVEEGEAVAEEEERGDAGEQLREGVEKEKDGEREKKRVLRRQISLKQKRHSVRGRSLVATHAFVPTHDDELALIEGETCVVLRCE